MILAKAPKSNSCMSVSCGSTCFLKDCMMRSAMEHPLIVGAMAGLDPVSSLNLKKLILSTLNLMNFSTQNSDLDLENRNRLSRSPRQ